MEATIKEAKPKKRTALNLKSKNPKRRGNPMNLYGIFKGKIFYENDEVLMS